MFIPDSDRTVYKRNPLVRVSCTFIFSPFLEISATPPSKLQSRLRKTFPNYTERPLVDDVPDELLSAFRTIPAFESYFSRSVSCFSNPESQAYVELGPEKLEIGTTGYTSWEALLPVIKEVEAHFRAVYDVGPYKRIGLRYENAISQKKLKLKTRWSSLLNKQLLGLLGNPNFEQTLVGQRIRTILDCSAVHGPETYLKLDHGLVANDDHSEILYLIDSEFFVTRTVDTNELDPLLTSANRENSNLFRWFVKPRLAKALGVADA